jgi:hypothetical protein
MTQECGSLSGVATSPFQNTKMQSNVMKEQD